MRRGKSRRLADAVRREYAASAGKYDLRWRRYSARSLELLRPRLTGQPLGRVLDLGCGTGALLPALVHWRCDVQGYLGIDLSPAMLVQAKRRPEAGAAPCLGFVAAEASLLPLASASIDTVVSLSSLHFWPRPERSLREVRRVLRPGGRLLLLDWDGGDPVMRVWSMLLRWTGHPFRRVYSQDQLQELLTRTGFRVEAVETSRVGWLWPVVLMEAVLPAPDH